MSGRTSCTKWCYFRRLIEQLPHKPTIFYYLTVLGNQLLAISCFGYAKNTDFTHFAKGGPAYITQRVGTQTAAIRVYV